MWGPKEKGAEETLVQIHVPEERVRAPIEWLNNIAMIFNSKNATMRGTPEPI